MKTSSPPALFAGGEGRGEEAHPAQESLITLICSHHAIFLQIHGQLTFNQ